MVLDCNASPDILIVDDTPTNLRLLSTMLTNTGYEVRKAINGQMALLSATTKIPDLILLDIKMPEMDGYETCEKLKLNPKTQHIPVIFISALDDVLDKVRAFSVGGVDYITKPFQWQEVLARIENQLKLQSLQVQLKEKNRTLQSLNQDLTRSNQSLEQFAHIVSHDLQQPLQSIMGFANLILLKHQPSLDPQVLDYLTRIVDASDRMQLFIQELLSLAALEQVDRELEPVDSAIVMAEVLENLQGVILDSNASITCESLPIVTGNAIQLSQLFQNLIGNALKYAQPNVTPTIRISADQDGTNWHIKVQDNGIGIAPEYLERIFAPFQKAHHGNYQGNGIGLATCQKIVELHNGHISVQSVLDQGTTFTVILPGTHGETTQASPSADSLRVIPTLG
ncbi:MAG: response regulator [Symploca sp. SIO2B6]|nr:response regulator [Symploca sp. SIO2B6]